MKATEKEVTGASKIIKKPQIERTPGKSVSFLAQYEEDMAPALLEALPLEVRGATTNFYKF